MAFSADLFVRSQKIYHQNDLHDQFLTLEELLAGQAYPTYLVFNALFPLQEDVKLLLHFHYKTSFLRASTSSSLRMVIIPIQLDNAYPLSINLIRGPASDIPFQLSLTILHVLSFTLYPTELPVTVSRALLNERFVPSFG